MGYLLYHSIFNNKGWVNMYCKESIPFAPSLIESMRSLGYSFESAIADIIDNSISAKAKRIDIRFSIGEEPYIIILDNGIGMSANEIEEAMRYGCKNPLNKRDKNDLGRFGLGLKSASLSQCRKLVVISKKKNKISGFSWDLDFVIENGSWMLIGYSQEELEQFPEIGLLDNVKSGTYVLLQNFDRIEESTDNLQKTLMNHMDITIDHLSLVFHRFLEKKIKMYINNQEIEPKDPFLTSNKSTQVKRTQKVNVNGVTITVKPYILPHLTKLTNEDLVKVGNKERLRNEQGFYVYRNERLIIWGTWFRLERKDELSKLARVIVDIPSELDYMWNIDIKKSSANLPDIIKRNLYNCVLESVSSSEVVHTYRGRRSQRESIDYVWQRIELRDKCYEYKINRFLPQIRILEETLDRHQLKHLNDLLNQLEEQFPINALYIDAAKGKIKEEKNLVDTEKIYKELIEKIVYAKNNGMDYLGYADLFMKSEPYCNYREVVEKVREEINLWT